MSRKRNARRTSRLGFTLMEVLLVLVILVVLAGFAIQNLTGTLEGAKVKQAKIYIGILSNALKQYQLEVGGLPSDINALHQQPSDIADPASWVQKLDNPIALDPWGKAYEYKLNGSSFEIRSIGPDGQSGTTDDITS
ncbi:MAG: type II secretion system protein GspG [Pirellula sp.]